MVTGPFARRWPVGLEAFFQSKGEGRVCCGEVHLRAPGPPPQREREETRQRGLAKPCRAQHAREKGTQAKRDRGIKFSAPHARRSQHSRQTSSAPVERFFFSPKGAGDPNLFAGQGIPGGGRGWGPGGLFCLGGPAPGGRLSPTRSGCRTPVRSFNKGGPQRALGGPSISLATWLGARSVKVQERYVKSSGHTSEYVEGPHTWAGRWGPRAGHPGWHGGGTRSLAGGGDPFLLACRGHPGGRARRGPAGSARRDAGKPRGASFGAQQARPRAYAYLPANKGERRGGGQQQRLKHIFPQTFGTSDQNHGRLPDRPAGRRRKSLQAVEAWRNTFAAFLQDGRSAGCYV